MKKLKKLKLEKSVIANLQNDEMNVLKGGQFSFYFTDCTCPPTCVINETCRDTCQGLRSCDTCGDRVTCYGYTCNPETSDPCTY